MNINGKELVAEFSKCPNCGGTNFMGDKLAKEQREVKDGEIFGAMNVQTPIISNETSVIIGAKITVAFVLADVCLDCGTLVAKRCEKAEGRMVPAPGKQPNAPVKFP